MDNDFGVNLFTNTLSIGTDKKGFIYEELHMSIDETQFIVRVKEVAGWFLGFKDKEEDETNDDELIYRDDNTCEESESDNAYFVHTYDMEGVFCINEMDIRHSNETLWSSNSETCISISY